MKGSRLMKILVMGTGALGGYYGGLLARAGHDLTFVARGPRLDRMRREGLRVESSASGDFSAGGAFTDTPQTAGIADLILFCVKSFDTEAAAAEMRPCVGPETAVLTLQNGIENEEILGGMLGQSHILAGAARIEATVDDAGTIRQIGPNHRIDFGEWPGGASARSQLLLEALRGAGIDAYLSADMRLELWRKFIFLCPVAGLTAATGRSVGEVATGPETRPVLERAIDEIYRLARAEAVSLPDEAVASTLAFIDSAPFAMKSSLQRDLERGKRVEIDALSGAVVRRGRLRGVDTPVHLTLLATIKSRSALPA
jgi:2-dehydropantoate 2-reductase